MPPCDGVKLRVGGADVRFRPGLWTSMRLFIRGVDVVADVQALPFRDNSVAVIECDAVLEQVPNPVLAVAEMARVLRPGGFLHVVVPFQQPFHAYPSDYQRWIIRGLRELLPESQFEVLKEGIRTGPTVTILAYFCEYCRIVAPATMGKIAYAAANWLVWPLRYLDLWLNRKPNARILANTLCILVEKG